MAMENVSYETTKEERKAMEFMAGGSLTKGMAGTGPLVFS